VVSGEVGSGERRNLATEENPTPSLGLPYIPFLVIALFCRILLASVYRMGE
jgi:hypothetical protein